MRSRPGLHRRHEVGEGVHHALGRAGGARGVHDGGEFVARAHRVTGQRRGLGDDVVPGGVGLLGVVGRQRVAHAGQAGGHAGFHAGPAVELADEQQLRAAVLQDLADGAGGQRGVQRHRDGAGHPDGVVGHQPVRGVLGQHRHPVARLDALGLQPRGHAPGLVHDLTPGVSGHLSRANGLGEGNAIGRAARPVVQALQRQLIGGDGGGHGSGFWKTETS